MSQFTDAVQCVQLLEVAARHLKLSMVAAATIALVGAMHLGFTLRAAVRGASLLLIHSATPPSPVVWPFVLALLLASISFVMRLAPWLLCLSQDTLQKRIPGSTSAPPMWTCVAMCFFAMMATACAIATGGSNIVIGVGCSAVVLAAIDSGMRRAAIFREQLRTAAMVDFRRGRGLLAIRSARTKDVLSGNNNTAALMEEGDATVSAEDLLQLNSIRDELETCARGIFPFEGPKRNY